MRSHDIHMVAEGVHPFAVRPRRFARQLFPLLVIRVCNLAGLGKLVG